METHSNEKEYKELDRSLFNEKQLSQIDIGYERNLPFHWYAKPEFSHAQMFELRIALQNGLNDEQMTFVANPSWTNEQMREIRLGMVHNIDYSVYAIPEYTEYQMRLIRIDLEDSEYDEK